MRGFASSIIREKLEGLNQPVRRRRMGTRFLFFYITLTGIGGASQPGIARLTYIEYAGNTDINNMISNLIQRANSVTKPCKMCVP
jgi:hypothetical protein